MTSQRIKNEFTTYFEGDFVGLRKDPSRRLDNYEKEIYYKEQECEYSARWIVRDEKDKIRGCNYALNNFKSFD